MKNTKLTVLTDHPQPWDYGETTGGPPPDYELPETLKEKFKNL